MSRPLWDEALDQHVKIGGLFRGTNGAALAKILVRQPGYTGTATDREIADMMSHMIFTSPTYAVTDNMVKVIAHGTDELRGMEIPLALDSNLPSKSGFIWLETPQMFPLMTATATESRADRSGDAPGGIGALDLATAEHLPWDRAAVRGVFWFPASVAIFEMIDGKRVNTAVDGFMTGVILNKNDATTDETALTIFPEFVPFDVTAWAADTSWREVTDEYWIDHYQTEPGICTESGAYWRRWLLAFWALCTDHIHVQRPARPVLRRAARTPLGAAPDYGDVRVIVLRHRTVHPDGHEPQPTDVNWSHQWMVNGHWGFRACGPGRTQRRLVYIAPYIKGPPDKPLIIRDDVNVLKR